MFSNELQFERYIRNLIATHITASHPEIYALKNKKAVDILICRDGRVPALFFIEVKYHQSNHGRLGFGSKGGGGFQPEIVSRKPAYFEGNLRWALANEIDHPGEVLFVPSSIIREYVAGGEVGEKFNNIQVRIFKEQQWLTESEFIEELRAWLGCR